MRRSDEVLRHAPAFCVHEAEVELGFGNPLLCGLAEPLHRLGVVLGYAQALGVHFAEIVLGVGVTLLGRR